MKKNSSLSCPLCKTKKPIIIRTGVRENPQEPVYGCGNCGYQFLEAPSYDLWEYYRNEYRKTHSNTPGQQMSPEAHFRLMRPLVEEQATIFRDHVPKGAVVLEIGCSAGYFLDAIQSDYSVYGNEWNPDDAAYVRDQLAIPCTEERLEDVYPGQKFTAICAFHVIEHVPDPIAWLKMVKDKLIGGGYIYLETPNADDALVALYDIPAFRDRWYRKAHLGYFNYHNLSAALSTVGFEAKIFQRQRYSLRNHLRWLMMNEGDADARMAYSPLQPVDKAHPAAGVVNRFFLMWDREYRSMLDPLKACDSLAVVGRKREI